MKNDIINTMYSATLNLFHYIWIHLSFTFLSYYIQHLQAGETV